MLPGSETRNVSRTVPAKAVIRIAKLFLALFLVIVAVLLAGLWYEFNVHYLDTKPAQRLVAILRPASRESRLPELALVQLSEISAPLSPDGASAVAFWSRDIGWTEGRDTESYGNLRFNSTDWVFTMPEEVRQFPFPKVIQNSVSLPEDPISYGIGEAQDSTVISAMGTNLGLSYSGAGVDGFMFLQLRVSPKEILIVMETSGNHAGEEENFWYIFDSPIARPRVLLAQLRELRFD